MCKHKVSKEQLEFFISYDVNNLDCCNCKRCNTFWRESNCHKLNAQELRNKYLSIYEVK